MAPPTSRLSKILSHLPFTSSTPAHPGTVENHGLNRHTLSPTYFLPRAAEIEPEGLAIYHVTANDKVIRRTYGEFSERAKNFAYYLLKHGYKRVGILATNTPGFLEAFFGAGGAGAVNIGINYRLKADDISYIFQHADADIIVADFEYASGLSDFRRARPSVPILIDADEDTPTGDFERAIAEGAAHDAATGGRGWAGLEAQAKDEDDSIALAYTSGTTARPKGVEYTHRGAYLAALANVIDSGLNIEFEGLRARYLWTLPMFHATGWTFPWAITAVRGVHYCLRKISYPAIWTLLQNEGITHFCAAPTVATLLCADPAASRLPHPVRVTVAASPPTAHLFKTMHALNLHPVHAYGLTETYGPITKSYYKTEWNALGEERRFEVMARQGYGFITSERARVIKVPETSSTSSNHSGDEIIDVARDGKEIGEIVFTGNILAKGYFADPAATRELWRGGVLHTGDLAVWYETGDIKILDRAKDIIISGGENISSASLEASLAHHPSILEVAVVGVPSAQWGEVPLAFITARSGASAGTVDPSDVVAWAKEQDTISRFAVPREVRVVAELPKTATGKVRKNVLREWAKEGEKDKEKEKEKEKAKL